MVSRAQIQDEDRGVGFKCWCLSSWFFLSHEILLPVVSLPLPRCINKYQQNNAEGDPAIDQHLIQGGNNNTPSCLKLP